MGGGKSRKHRKSRKPGAPGESDESSVTPGLPAAEGLSLVTTHSPILDMPLEILNLIMKDFELHHLLDACLASRTLSAAATPALYHTITLRPNTGPLPQIPRLLRSLMSRPELCEHVKTVVIGSAGQRDVPHPAKHSPYFPIPLGSINISRAVDLISQTGLSHRDCWVEHFKTGDTEAALTLLLALLPNLKSLTIEPEYNESIPFLSLAIQEAFGTSKARGKTRTMFQKLEVVSFEKDRYSHRYKWPSRHNSTAWEVYGACGPPERTDWSNFAALSLFYLPSLREISVSIDSTEEHDRHEFWPCGAPDLGRLEVMKVDRIRENRLGSVLATCSRLRKLTWTIRYDNDSDVNKVHSSRTIDRDQVVAVLAPISKTLTDLTFITLAHREPSGRENLITGPTGSFRGLRDFASIKTLTVSWLMLMGQDKSSPWDLADVLPRNLEHLVINDDWMFDHPPGSGFRMDEFKVYAAIRDWLRNWREVTPRLKSFSIKLWRITTGTWTVRVRQELKQLCKRAGVEHHQDDGFEDDDAGWRIPAGWEW